MNERPRIKLTVSPGDLILESLGWLAVAGLWILTLWDYPQLPDSIPTHFNGAGHPDGYGSRASILVLPFISTLVYVGMTLLNRRPDVFNYPVTITADNAFKHYTHATRMIRYVKLFLVFIFGMIVFQTIQTTKGRAAGLDIWFLPGSLGLVFIPLIFFLIQSLNVKRNSNKPVNE